MNDILFNYFKKTAKEQSDEWIPLGGCSQSISGVNSQKTKKDIATLLLNKSIAILKKKPSHDLISFKAFLDVVGCVQTEATFRASNGSQDFVLRAFVFCPVNIPIC